MANPYPPNTYPWKVYDTFEKTQTPAAPAPGGKPVRHNLNSQITGSTNVFTLPDVPNPSEVQIILNGLSLDDADFSVVGNQLTLSQTPKLNDSLVAIY